MLDFQRFYGKIQSQIDLNIMQPLLLVVAKECINLIHLSNINQVDSAKPCYDAVI